MNTPKPSHQPDASPRPNRRNFLKTTSAAVVGGSLLGGLALERSVFAASDDTLKLGLVGCGGRGSGAANQALSTKGSVKLFAVADAFADSLEKGLANLKAAKPDRVDVPPERQFVGLDAYKNVINLCDVIIFATPPGFRPIHFEAAVNAGKHVFIEKPVATDAPGVRRILAAAEIAKQKNLKVGVGLQRHHDPGYIETIKRLHDGAIGDLVSLRCYWNGTNGRHYIRKPGETEMEYQIRIWYFFTWLCGDHIVEQHVHNLDAVSWMKQAYPVKAMGMGGRQVRKGPEFGEIWDHHAVEFEYADGSHLFSQCRQMGGCWSSVSEHALGTKGTVDITGSGFLIKNDSAWRYPTKEKHNAYQIEHDDFFDAIRNDTPYNEAEHGAKSTMMAIMGRMATYTGQMIEWDRALNSQVSLAPSAYTWDATPVSLPDANGYYPTPIPGDPAWIKKII
jgi:myo-inositol 2-dehydrogenase/D-chiro-inositol 1-dehydrogenase